MYKHFATVFFIAKVTPCFSNKCTLFDIKGNMGKEAYRTFRVVFIVDEPRVYRAPSAF